MAESESETMDQQFCLRWNNFQSNITSQFETLRDDEDFVDVTFACGGRRLGAHKIVLSACSPYFKQLFKNNPCPHPIIFMRDVEIRQVTALLEFMYSGEVNIAQTELSLFLKTAEALQIRGLTEASNQHKGAQEKIPILENVHVSNTKNDRPKSTETSQSDKNSAALNNITEKRIESKRVNHSAETISPLKRSCFNNRSDNYIDSIKSEEISDNDTLNNQFLNETRNDQLNSVYIDPKMEYDSDNASNSEENLMGLDFDSLHTANTLGFNSVPGTSQSSAEMHDSSPVGVSTMTPISSSTLRSTPHSLDRRPCPICGRVYSNHSNLRQHMNLIHNPEAVTCPLCQKMFRTKLYLRRHLASFHNDTTRGYNLVGSDSNSGFSGKNSHVGIHVNAGTNSSTSNGSFNTKNGNVGNSNGNFNAKIGISTNNSNFGIKNGSNDSVGQDNLINESNGGYFGKMSEVTSSCYRDGKLVDGLNNGSNLVDFQTRY